MTCQLGKRRRAQDADSGSKSGSESDEENLSGLSNITLQIMRINVPETASKRTKRLKIEPSSSVIDSPVDRNQPAIKNAGHTRENHLSVEVGFTSLTELSNVTAQLGLEHSPISATAETSALIDTCPANSRTVLKLEPGNFHSPPSCNGPADGSGHVPSTTTENCTQEMETQEGRTTTTNGPKARSSRRRKRVFEDSAIRPVTGKTEKHMAYRPATVSRGGVRKKSQFCS
ncbi:hypothetical protein B0T14DRAFT_514155 [Immersiella caudata]|uniref:Uncharacterized protein n=1 Tax=Immersiella caudata TaxID=314043 RepID=A0AA39WWD7_9PEZI|nr:hypothetical protein B0T14DRAFT_514155 [Immersiella caudata]